METSRNVAAVSAQMILAAVAEIRESLEKLEAIAAELQNVAAFPAHPSTCDSADTSASGDASENVAGEREHTSKVEG